MARRFAFSLPFLSVAVAGALVFAELGAPAHASPPPGADYRLSSLRVFNRVVLLVKEQYVEPSRIHPREMLVAALEAVEKRVPEVLIEEPKGDVLGVVVGTHRREFFLDDISSLWELSFKLRDIFRFLETRVSEDVERREIEYAAVNGMLSKLDPHSVLLEPRSSKEMKLSTKGEFGGLGIVISIRDGWLTVISPIDGTPADKAGIKAQDRIVKIGEESTINMGLDEAVERLRGKPNTKVTIWITRKGVDEPRRIEITRAIIKVDSVTNQLLDGGVGYVKIKAFQAGTADDTSKAVQQMEKKNGGRLSGLILDLRNNPGGLLDQSVEVSNLFLEDGVIVVTQEGGQRGERKEIRAVARPNKIRVPLVVLVNGGSASASEIVSGAVKNRGRGLIVGDQTFGKGSVQQLYDFPDSSSLKLTIGQYLTPGDVSIQSVGITPDIQVRPMFADDAESMNLFPDTHTREGDLEAHLDDARTRSGKPVHRIAYLSETLEEGEQQRRDTSSSFHDDFEIAFARRVLKTTRNAKRDVILGAAEKVVSQVQSEQERSIAKALKKMGVDWDAGSTAPGAQLSVNAVGVEPITAGESMKLKLEVTNSGSAPAYRVKGLTESTLGYFIDREFLFGKIGPGETRAWTTEVKLPKDLGGRRDLMRVTVSDASGKKLASLDVPLEVTGLPRPRFSYALFIDDSRRGNGDGLLQVGEEVDLAVSIQNRGAGPAERPTALLKNLGGPEVFIETGRRQLDELAPGASALARFSFRVQSFRDEVELRLQVFDGVMGDYLLEKLTFPVRETAASSTAKKQTVEVSRAGVPVFAAADGSAAVLAHAEQGSRLPAVAEIGDFVRVKIGKDMFGYVAAAAVGPAKGRAVIDASGVPTGLSTVYGRDPPQIAFPGVAEGAAVVVDSDKYELSFTVSDDGPVDDVYVFVNDQKVFYKKVPAKGPTRIEQKTMVDLESGANVVTVVAREDDEFAQREILTVFSTRGDPLEKKQISRH